MPARRPSSAISVTRVGVPSASGGRGAGDFRAMGMSPTSVRPARGFGLIRSIPLLALAIIAGLGVTVAAAAEPARPPLRADLVIYGATPGGITAAIQARKMGRSAILIEPSRFLGGLTAGGLGATDIGNKKAIGGLAREFYRRVYRHYDRPDAWRFETKVGYWSKRQQPGEDTMWTFEPKVATAIFTAWLAEHGITPIHGERLDLKTGVVKEGTRIVSIRMESGREFAGAMFIDATYEGDLLAKAGCSYRVGREANAEFGETLNGIQVGRADKHQFIVPVDPWVRKGDRSSGLLPGVSDEPPGEDGAADHRVQAYCYRLCTTDVPENRVPWPKPATYDPLRFELLLRNFEAGDQRIPWAPILMPNRKTDTNNNFAISTDHLGANYLYPDADYPTRERIIQDHLDYQQGLMWTLANSPRVPEKVRKHFMTWGLAKDEFIGTGNWPHQLYVREARRLVGEYVMAERNCRGAAVAEDSAGMGAYGMDSHNVRRHVDASGFARNEGDIQVHGFVPYPISYRSLIPKRAEATNLLVPVSMSATHIAYGSIRMEPVFMVLGQSTATAAVMALESNLAVQDVPYPKLRERLLADGQALEWTGPKPVFGVDPKSLPGIVLDDTDAMLKGSWDESHANNPFVGAGYRHDGNAAKGWTSATWTVKVPASGRYAVRLAWPANANRATNVPIRISHADGVTDVTVNQRRPSWLETAQPTAPAPALKGASEKPTIRKSAPPAGPAFHQLGVFRFEEGKPGEVTVSNRGTDGYVILDALQLEPVRESP
jgi:hypothetical protein